MKYLLLLLLFVVSTTFSAGQDTSPSPDLQEAEKLSAQSEEFYRRRQYDKALELELKELMLREKIGDEKYVAMVKFNLGGIYREKGDFSKAAKYFEASVIHYRKAFGENHIKTFNALNNLARVLLLQKEKTKAVEILEQARLIAEKLNGNESQQVSDLYVAKAQVYWSMNRLADAEEAYESSILVLDKILKSSDYNHQLVVDEYICFLVTTSRDVIVFEDTWEKFGRKRGKAAGEENTDDVVNGKAIKLVRPDLPDRLKAPVGGVIVVLRITIAESGDVVQVRSVCNARAEFAKASRDAAYESKFSPTLVNGVPRKVTRLLIYSF